MKRSILATASLAALVALSACSSNDDDDTPNDVSGVDADGSGDTSELAEDRELSSTPGGDTSAIAGYWSAPVSADFAADSRYVLITGNGLQTSYERQIVDGTEDEVCYSEAGPQSLVPNGDGVYTPDGEGAYTAVRSGEDGETLTVTLEPELVQTWTLVEDGSPDDLPLCLGTEEEIEPAGGENVLPGEGAETDPGGTSMLAPDGGEDTPPRSDPSGDDTAAIAGLWDATSGEAPRVDERYVLISDDGLYTDYDYRDDAFGDEGNCYIVTPLTLDLETTEGDSSTYSVADGRTFEAAPADADTLTLTFGGAGDESWQRVVGEDAGDLEACDAE